ncbi:MFP transporter [Burkholderia sp. MSMB1078WGS]|uniref:HlyD family secretion protein n=1 Tax=Burkholderia sp. MSMB1078WGS TaxID=1637900 RepID=UPI0007541932|nr:HlyD family efflux transporter periplasmic adaptor subunit [Burkholderia sp. MSMB1078WGS]KVT20177.1 MFP transporter [Burkholderia sp. MSMB1078WGS]
MTIDNLFRPEARAAQRTSMLGEIVLVRPVSFTFLAVAAVCMALGVMLLFAFGSYTRRTTVDGVIVPDAGLVKVYAQQPGIVLRKAVLEGQHVTRGMVLYTVSTDLQSAFGGRTQAALIDQARRRKSSLLQEIDKTRLLQQDERDTLRAKLASLRAELSRIDDQLAEQRSRTSIAADGVARYRRLLTQDYISTDQFQQREADLLDQRSKLLGLQRDRANVSQALDETANELNGLPLKQQNRLSQIDRSVIDVEQALIESEAKREIVVTAPETGVATAVIAEPGQMIDAAHPVASIVPDGAHWQANLFVPSAAVGFVHVGDAVLVRYQAYPYQKFGQYRARVTSIARTALSTAELSTSGAPAAGEGSFYRITAALASEHVTAYGKPQPLQAGMALKADILQERRRLYEWVLEPLYSLTGKF